MPPGTYNPEIHHRRSIRLEKHDYAGGGLYFITICAYRDAGDLFAPTAVKEMIARCWEDICAQAYLGHPQGAPLQTNRTGAPCGCPPAFNPLPYVVMPDHFHGLIRIAKGQKELGEYIGAFKSTSTHDYIIGVREKNWKPFPGKVWHRNYYESIVWDAKAEENIAHYIQMNPWRCVMNFGNGLRGIGNPTLWNTDKVGILCSRMGAPSNEQLIAGIPEATVYFGGFHSPPEKIIFNELLRRKARVILCPAWKVESAINPQWLEHLQENRLLILEMTNQDGNLAAAEQRNRFVIQNATNLHIPHITPGGMLDRLIREKNP